MIGFDFITGFIIGIILGFVIVSLISTNNTNEEYIQYIINMKEEINQKEGTEINDEET